MNPSLQFHISAYLPWLLQTPLKSTSISALTAANPSLLYKAYLTWLQTPLCKANLLWLQTPLYKAYLPWMQTPLWHISMTAAKSLFIKRIFLDCWKLMALFRIFLSCFATVDTSVQCTRIIGFTVKGLLALTVSVELHFPLATDLNLLRLKIYKRLVTGIYTVVETVLRKLKLVWEDKIWGQGGIWMPPPGTDRKIIPFDNI